MNLFKEILIRSIEKMKIDVSLPEFIESAAMVVELESYNALCKIKEIIADESLDDPACFHKIEAIVTALENVGSDGGFRHDFG